MDYSLYFNHLSPPAHSAEDAFSLMIEAFQGVLFLNQINDRYFLYFDGDNLNRCPLAADFTYGDFKERLDYENEIDLLSFIFEIEDKAPFINYIDDEDFSTLSAMMIYIDERPYVNMDIFAHAWLQKGIMLSLATDIIWDSHFITFSILRDREHSPISCIVDNISRRNHGEVILEREKRDIRDVCPDVFFADSFIAWYESCKKEEKNKIVNTLEHCCLHRFDLGRPFIDTLNNSRYPNMKEIRAGNAHAQSGKIRILFALDPNRRANILTGFIKNSNDYSEPLRIADSLFADIIRTVNLRRSQ